MIASSATCWLLRRLFKGITPLWGRQIPYTMMKFGAARVCKAPIACIAVFTTALFPAAP